MRPRYRVLVVDGISDMEKSLNDMDREGYRLHTVGVRNSVYPFLVFELEPRLEVQALKSEVIDIQTRKPVPTKK